MTWFPLTYFTRSVATVVIVVTLPVLLVQAYSTYRTFDAASRDAQVALSREADAVGRLVAEVFHQAELLLELSLVRPEALAVDADQCALLFRGLELSPLFVNMNLSSREGLRLCSWRTPVGGVLPKEEQADWFGPAVRSRGFALSGPFMSRTNARQVVMLSKSVRDARGDTLNVLSVAIDLLRLAELLERHGAAESQRSASVLASSNHILARYPHPEKFVGTQVSDELGRVAVLKPGAIVESTGVDSVRKLFSRNEVGLHGVYVTVAAPVAEVYREPYLALTRNIALAAVVLVASLAVAVGLTRALSRPLRSLLGAVNEVAEGAEGKRANEDLPGEFGHLARRFNHMMEVLVERSARMRQTAQRSQRQSREHQAVSATYRAIARATDDRALFSEICAICINVLQAKASWVSRLDGEFAAPVALGGVDPQLAGALQVDLSALSVDASTPTTTALREGIVCVVNEMRNDARTIRWASKAAEVGWRSCIGLPVTCEGEVVACLHLVADVESFFDAELVAVLSEMAANLSFALDNLARERARESAEQRSREHEEQLAGILDTAQDAIITVDEDQRIVIFNQSAVRIFGLPADQALGQPLSRFIPERFHRVHAEHVRGFVHDGTTRRMGVAKDLAARRVDGTEFPVEASISKAAARGKVLLTVVLRDLGAVRAAEAAHRFQLAAEAASRAKTAFLSRMSHELRTPLNAVLGFSQLMRSATGNGRLPVETEVAYLEHIIQAGTQLRALIDDVLDVARIEAGVVSIAVVRTDVCALLDEVAAQSEPGAREKSVELHCDYDRSSALYMMADPVRLQQVLTNLVSNAIKYNRPGGQVHLNVNLEGDQVKLEVRDTGLGMTATQLEGLFEPFNRLGRERSSIEGTGIGMSLCKDLTELMKGSLTVRSAEGVGTTVEVSLPLGEPRAQLGRMSAFSRPGAVGGAARELRPSVAAAAPKGRVCYIEDNPVNALLVGEFLKRWPDVVLVEADTGRAGLACVRAAPPDLVLLDMNLPDMSGLEVLSALRSDERTRGLLVVALSASALPAEMEEARQAGADDYWTKPMDFDQMEQGLRRLLRSAELVLPAGSSPKA